MLCHYRVHHVQGRVFKLNLIDVQILDVLFCILLIVSNALLTTIIFYHKFYISTHIRVPCLFNGVLMLKLVKKSVCTKIKTCNSSIYFILFIKLRTIGYI